jgi:hypothetical protein
MMTALSNVSPTHLFDRDVARAWGQRSAEIPAKATLAGGRAHQSTLVDAGDSVRGVGAEEGRKRLRVLSS